MLRLPIALFALTLLGASPPPAPGPVVATTASAAQDVAQAKYDDFVKRFKQYLKVADSGEMASMVARDPSTAVRYADTLCQQIAIQGSDELEAQIAALRVAWSTSMKTRFVDRLYEYHSLLQPRPKANRARLVTAFDGAYAKYQAALDADDTGPALETVALEYEGLAGGFAEVGDHLNVARCWQMVGYLRDRDLRGDDADRYAAYKAYRKAMDAYERIEMAGPDKSRLQISLDDLVANGFAGEAPDPDAPGEGQPDVAAAGPVTLSQMTFEPIEEVTDFERPNYYADELYQVWPALAMQAKGTSAKFNAMADHGPRVERTASAQFTVHDASGETPEPVTVTGNPTVVTAVIEEGGVKREWAFVAQTGLEQDFYQSRQTMLSLTDLYLSLFSFNAASMVGEVAGESVRVIDDNMDGIYGSPPLRWQYIGLAEGQSQPDMDGVVVGKSKRALPWSEFMQIGGQWLKLESRGGGIQIAWAPIELETGTLKLAYKGVFPQWLVVKGKGVLENCYYDVLANGKRGVEVPVGEYELFAGVVRKGKKNQTMKCLILPGEGTPSWTVTAGKETELELGAPFSFDFQYTVAGDDVTVAGSSVAVLGKAGERYERLWNCVPVPDVSMRKAGSRSGGKGESMPTVTGSLDELTETGQRRWSFFDVWRPLSLTLPRKKSAEAIELSLSEKKNKLFGSIKSEWK